MPSVPQIQVITPNDDEQTPFFPTTSVFLAGPTGGWDWRKDFLARLGRLHSGPPYPSVTVYNPFQPKWDKTWKEDLTAARFRTQVEWELERQDKATVVAVYFHAGCDAPISLLELGLCARSGKAVVGCDEGYYKRGNVQAVCQRYRVPLTDSVDGLAALVAEKLKGMRA